MLDIAQELATTGSARRHSPDSSGGVFVSAITEDSLYHGFSRLGGTNAKDCSSPAVLSAGISSHSVASRFCAIHMSCGVLCLSQDKCPKP